MNTKKHDIKDLGALLTLKPGEKLISYDTKQLTKAGENYGSLMLAVDANIRDETTAKERTLKLAAKLCPPNEWIAKMFNVPVTFKKENAFYSVIVPTLQKFQRLEGAPPLECFPKCFGSRISLDSASETVDNDAVLLLENLKVSGYETADCMAGFDLSEAEMVLKDLARFHAVPIALKLRKPQVFQAKLMPHLEVNENFGEFSEEMAKNMEDAMVEVITDSADTKHLAERVRAGLKRGNQAYKMVKQNVPREPYATMIHNDFWVNNTMLKYAKNGRKPERNVMVDFQLIDYGSPAADIVFFLFSSVQKSIRDAHYDHLLNLYHSTFLSTLEELNCDTRPFTFGLLQDEISHYATEIQFFHVMLMMRPIYSLKDKVKELSDLTEEDMIGTEQLSELYPIRMREAVLSFAEKNWL